MNITRNITDLPVVQIEISDNDIVSEEHQNRLMYWRDIFRMGQFDIGDIATEEVKSNAMQGRQLTQERIFKAIGRFCGKKERTIRYYYETSVFYPSEIRQEFNILPFSHFVEARGFGNRWREFLERSMLFPGSGVDFIRNQMVAASNYRPVAADFSGNDLSHSTENQKTDFRGNSEYSDNDETEQAEKETCETSQGIPRRATMHDCLSTVNAVLARLPELEQIAEIPDMLDDYPRHVVLSAIADLRKHLPELSRKLV